MQSIQDELIRILQDHREKSNIGAQPPGWEDVPPVPEEGLTNEPDPGTLQE